MGVSFKRINFLNCKLFFNGFLMVFRVFGCFKDHFFKMVFGGIDLCGIDKFIGWV